MTRKRSYVVRPGDTMYEISRRFGVSLKELIEFNPQIEDPEIIYPGDTIYIPRKNFAGSWLEPGYEMKKIIGGLTFPIAMTFDDQGNTYFGESGFAYGPVYDVARIVKLNSNGTTTEIARDFLGPLTSITWYKGYFYVAEGGFPGKITRVSLEGEKCTLIDNLASGGDHFTSEIVFGPDEKMYVGVGTATNSGVVGLDNISWVREIPYLYDYRCCDTPVTGENFVTENPLTEEEGDKAVTGSFRPFGQPVNPGEVIPGQIPCKGAILRANPDGSDLEVVATGLRNPFGLRFDSYGNLFAVDHGMDVRGSRPVANDWDYLWKVKEGYWYGFPDIRGGIPITDPRFQTEEGPPLKFLMAAHPRAIGRPAALFDPHSAAMKLDFSTCPGFGFVGDAFVAEFGSMFPVEGQPGQRIVRVEPETGAVKDFFVKGEKGLGPEHPVAVYFDPTRTILYVVDFGLMTQETHQEKGDHEHGFVKKTGAIWKIYRQP